MTETTRTPRSAAGILFLAAGLLLVLSVTLAIAGSTASTWLVVLSYLGIAAGFIVLAGGTVGRVVARIGLIAGGAGWIALALAEAGLAIPGDILILAVLLTATAGVVGSIALVAGRDQADVPGIVFVATTIVAAVLLLCAVAAVPLGDFATVLVLLLGAGLVATGILYARFRFARGRNW
jgi:hypothetical protein